ncbi:hypothetical protein T492DRAFT_139756 [Pavlovales sp. CCMP2436]|nr:hypothetical protein T492DRAFT_139756 [Pavlovales sp. CCMP2436]
MFMLCIGGSRVCLDSAGPGHGSTFRLELVLPEALESTSVLGDYSPRFASQLLLARSPSSNVGESRDSENDAQGRNPHEPEGATAGTHAEGLLGGGRSVKTKSQARPQLHFPPGFRVLHVEDDAILRRSFELRVVKKLGVPYDVAVNGAEAVSATHDGRHTHTHSHRNTHTNIDTYLIYRCASSLRRSVSTRSC